MIISRTPLRLALLGEGCDFPEYINEHDCGVISAGINKYTYCIVKKRLDSLIYVNYTKKDIVRKVDEVRHELAREALRATGISEGVEVTYTADVPGVGSGLGSIASVAVGSLNAMFHLSGKTLEGVGLAREAAEIVVEILGKPVGLQDFYSSALGGLNYIEFTSNGLVSVEPLGDTGLRKTLMQFYVGRSREESSILEKFRQKVQEDDSKVGKMLQNVKIGKKLLSEGNLESFAELVDEEWEIKKTIVPEVTDNDIDVIINKAKKAGAWCGKLCGGGGGGFLTLIVPEKKRERVREAMSGLSEIDIDWSIGGSEILLNVR